jgi:hypothetical protein
MTNLSPAAQAVLDAFTGNDTIHGLHLVTPRLASALRAAADQLDHSTSEHILQSIADELEAQ